MKSPYSDYVAYMTRFYSATLRRGSDVSTFSPVDLANYEACSSVLSSLDPKDREIILSIFGNSSFPDAVKAAADSFYDGNTSPVWALVKNYERLLSKARGLS